MSRTNAKFQQKLGNPDGQWTITPKDITEAISSPVGGLHLATALISYEVGASLTAALFAQVGGMLVRTGTAPWLQENWGTSTQTGTTGNFSGPNTTANTSDPDAGPYPYAPPFTAAQQSWVPQTGYVPKGVKPISLDVYYAVATADVTTLNVSLTAVNFVNNTAAPTVTTLIATANLTKTKRTNLYVVNVPLSATQNYIVTADTYFQMLINVVTPSTSVFDFYGATINYHYNFL